jgi:hypothetical protein
MTDKDVEREIAENQQRQAENEAGDDSVVETVERAIDPITEALMPDAVESDDVAEQRRLNDAEQRPE